MATSRIFVRGLPPSYTENDFRDHFAKRYAVTDAKLFPQRRIGYVGFKTPQDAESAVKYFNKSFIRMSKIWVELARDVSVVALPGRLCTSADIFFIRSASPKPSIQRRSKMMDPTCKKVPRQVF